VRPGAGLIGVLRHGQPRIVRPAVEHVLPDFCRGHLGIIDAHLPMFGQQVAGDIDGGGLPRVVRVLLKGKAEHRDFLVGDRIEELLHNPPGKTPFLRIVHRHHAVPVVRHVLQAEALAQVGQVENILLKAGTAEADRRLEEFRADAAVPPDGVGHLVHVRPGRLAQGRDGVDGGDALGEEGVRHELGEFRRPEVGRDDPLARHPVRIDADEGLDRLVPIGRAFAADQHAVGIGEVLDRRALRQKLGVGKHLKLQPLGVRCHDRLNGIGRFYRDGRLLDDDLAALGMLGDGAGNRLDVTQVGRPAGADAVGLGRGVDRHEDDVGLLDLPGDVRGKKQIPAARLLHDLLESRLEDRQVARVPRRDAGGVHVHHRDGDAGAFQRDHGHGGPAHVTGTNAADVHHERGRQNAGLRG